MERKKVQLKPKQPTEGAPHPDLHQGTGETRIPGEIPVELHELLGVQKQDLPLICPHCHHDVKQLIWRKFGQPAQAVAIGCGNCRNVLGSQLLIAQVIY